MISARISRFGERRQADDGLELSKIGVNHYGLSVKEGETPRVFVETLTPDRVATLVSRRNPTPNGPRYFFDIFTFNLLNGYHPGSDLVVRVFEEGDKDLVRWEAGKTPMEAPLVADGEKLLVQVHSREFRMANVHDRNGRPEIETLITRTPPTPLETNIEIAVVRSFGPLFSR